MNGSSSTAFLRFALVLQLLVLFAARSSATAPAITSLSPTSGAIGTSVTITGTDFGSTQGGSTVTFNGTSASVSMWSLTNIVATVPSGATTGNVVVTVSGQASNGASFTVTPLPSGWTDGDIGSVGQAGSASFNFGTFVVKGAGLGLNNNDAVNFVYQSLSGDGTIIARLASLTNTSTSEAGLMIRSTLDPSSTDFTVLNTTSADYIFYKATIGTNSGYLSGPGAVPPTWLKLVRSGNTFSGYSSSNGADWTLINSSQTITMSQNVYVGLWVSSGVTSSLATANFDNVSLTSGAGGPPVITSLSATTGPAGTQVQINGSGFGASQNGSEVYLGNLAASVASWSASAITITIPTGATSSLIVVSVAPTMNDSNGVEFEVTNQPLPPPWLNQDVGPTGLQGSATFSNRTFTLNGAGRAVFYNPDGFHFAYQPLTGDGSIVARVTSITGSSTQAGVMIRETLTGSSVHAFAFYQPPAEMYYRTSTGGSTSSQTVSLGSTAYPYWVRLDRSGSTFTSYVSLDGSYWKQIGSSELITMAETAYIGLGVSSNSTSSLATVTFDNVWVSSATAPGPAISSVSATTGSIGSQVSVYGTGFGATQGNSVLTINGITMTINSWSDSAIVFTIPSGATSGLLDVFVAPSMNASNTFMFTITTQPLAPTWLDQDIGNVGLAGSATYSNGNFTVKAAGQVISNTQDGFHFVYQPLSGDGAIIARVSNIQNASNPEIGVMIRESVQPGAENAFVDFTPNTAMLNMRVTTGGSTTQQSVGFSGPTYPYWVKLARSGNTFTGYVSKDGTNWTQVGSQTFTMAQNTFIGLAVCNQTTSSLVTATFDSVSLSTDLLVPPVISTTSATTGPVGSQVNITGNGFGATQGTSLVVLNGSPVTINSWSQSAITITIPTGATSGLLEVLLGPTMNSSNPAVFAVTTQPLPVGWLDRDIGAVGKQGSATYSGGVFTVNAVGKINGTADALHFVYQPLVGDGVFVARVTGITNADSNAQVGIMVRETLNSNATGTFVWMYPGSSPNLSTRTTTGSSLNTQSTSFSHDVIPFWVKLARIGSTFAGYISNDGVNWTQVGTSQTISMAQLAYVGLAAANWWNNTSLLTATFDNVSITPGTMPMISGLSPNSGGIATQVTVTGSNFGSSQGSSTLTFNGVAPASISSWANGQIVATIPSNASTGPVVVTVNSIASNTDQIFSFYNPILTGVSPSVGQINSKIVLSGTGFQNAQYTGNHVQFNGLEAGILAWSDTAIVVNPPYSGPASGPVTVIVGGVSSNSLPFTLENLSITGISPNIGPVGSQVTITGTGFGPSQSTSIVTLSANAASIQSWSDTQIVAIVPAGTPSGPISVFVGGVVWYGPNFTVTQSVQVIDSKSNQSTYTSAMIGGLWVSLGGQGSGCSTCTQRGNISYTYDAAGHPLTRTDENGNVTTYTYDSNGNVLTVTVPISSGHTATTTYTYNSFGEVLTATDPLGNVTTNTYDASGNLLSVKTPAPGNGASASVTQFVYDTKGELTRITDPLGKQTNIAYFSTGMIQTITDAQSNVTTYAYDSQGNRTSVTDANSKQTTFTYDAMNRLTKITYPDTTTTQFGYDIRGRRTSVTDQNSKQTTYAYDDADRLTSVTDAANNVTTYGYDTESNLTSIQDANLNTTTFDYDAFGRVTETHFPSGQIEQYAYDNVGNLTGKTDRKNQQITYTYDQLNRLTVKTYPDTTTVNYTYDNDSRLTQVSDPTGTYQFTFDNMGRLTGTTTSYAFLTGRNFTTGYGYDAASNRTSFTDPESGSTAYVYDTLNRLQTLTPPAAISGGSFGFGYDVLSRRTSLTRPNAVNTSYSYDNLSRLLSVTHAKGGVTLDGASYGLDNAGNRTSKSDLYAGVTTNYGYDNIYELLSATQGASTTESYTYDPAGNRLSNLSGSGWSNNTSNELTSRPGVSYTFDNNGNELTKVDSTGTTSYTWDFENRLTSVTLPGSGGSVSFKYDPFGRRIYKSSSAGTSVFAYDGDNLVEETNATGGVVARYLQGLNIDEPLAMLRSATTSYYQADGLGSVTSLTNAAGTVAQNYTYDSFGNIIATTGSLVNSFRYTGREWDTETSLYYYRARYYDPQTGRFVIQDPQGLSVGPNLYAYTGNSPISRIDPSGLDWQLGISGSATVWPLTFGIGGGVTFGISSDGTIGGTSVFANEQGNALAGPGVFAGAGLGIAVGHTNGPLTGGGSVSVIGEADAGYGPSVGVNGSYTPKNGSISGGVSKALPGVGVGIAAGLGVSYSRTQVSPTIGQAAHNILNYIIWKKILPAIIHSHSGCD